MQRTALENAQRLEPTRLKSWLPRASTNIGGSVITGWLSTFGRVTKMLPGSSEVPYALGLIARRAGRWDQSIAYSSKPSPWIRAMWS